MTWASSPIRLVIIFLPFSFVELKKKRKEKTVFFASLTSFWWKKMFMLEKDGWLVFVMIHLNRRIVGWCTRRNFSIAIKNAFLNFHNSKKNALKTTVTPDDIEWVMSLKQSRSLCMISYRDMSEKSIFGKCVNVFATNSIRHFRFTFSQ